MTKNDKAFLISVCIGDGSLERDKSSNSVRLKIEHSTKQLEYNQWKLEKLHSILGGTLPTMRVCDRIRKETPTQSCYFRIRHKYFRIIRKWLYTPKKRVSKFLLQKLDPIALAVWFMDDGNTELCTKNSFRVTLSCHCSYSDALILQNYFKDIWGIQWNINKVRGKYEDQFYLRCSTIEARKLFNIIHKHIVPCMRYKLNVPYHLWHECDTPVIPDEDIV